MRAVTPQPLQGQLFRERKISTRPPHPRPEHGFYHAPVLPEERFLEQVEDFEHDPPLRNVCLYEEGASGAVIEVQSDDEEIPKHNHHDTTDSGANKRISDLSLTEKSWAPF